MKTIVSKTQFLTILFLPFLLNSCMNDDAGEDFDAFVDVFIVKKKLNEEIKTAAAYYVYGNNTIGSAIVFPPDNSGNPVSLIATDERNFDFHHAPDSMEFSILPPEPGSYTFEIESIKGEKTQKTDLLKIINLSIPEIISTTFDSNNLSLTAEWQKVTDTDALFVKLTDKEGDLVFISHALANTVSELQIVTESGNWISPVNNGDELVLQIQSVVIEDNAEENYSLYNIEATAVAEKLIVWGE